jgi:RNA-binding protein YlmH
MLPREELLKRVENREIVARIIDLAEQAIKTWEIVESRAAAIGYLSE